MITDFNQWLASEDPELHEGIGRFTKALGTAAALTAGVVGCGGKSCDTKQDAPAAKQAAPAAKSKPQPPQHGDIEGDGDGVPIVKKGSAPKGNRFVADD